MRALLRDREFLAYFAARQGARLGYSIETVAIGWQIYGLRHSAFDIGLVGLVLFVPQLLFAIPAGMLADRFDRRIVCVACALGEVTAELGFVALVLTGSRSLAVNLAAVALIGAAHSIGDPAERALLAGIVRSERFVHAQALTTSVTQVVTIVGPALGGVLIAIGLPVAFAAAAVSYALAALAFSFLAPRLTEETFLERSTLVQLDTPNAMRGRVSAIENIFIGASNQLGAFESGAPAALAGTVASVVIGGVATLAVIGLWAILFPSLRSYDRIGAGQGESG